MIQLSKQQCGNCRNGRSILFDEDSEPMPLPAGMTMCLHAGYVHGPNRGTAAPNLSVAWCSAWELHPDYYEIFGFPSEEVQLEQQRMLLQMHGGSPDPAGINDAPFTYD